ncbi:hypothetical protein GLOTRDRAFT_93964 [Gloeophyllum trabeum ATCC 11539]|uniref:G-patch domain-containing protein n=1 Tax=Gloeophyllum trabeum (strain ATCC 11539 / FP-39264 / Madison 617) TaxID=670483 RepID=S7RNV5_GLOTA|nr:uncharacterized protein GLOTRDRAFT_93964 [Gloeophyllum trabeum ATCC 11539]EPQ54459.1 hypothetical protein GLOTRDRAFT_93964 [Gloeophyllum trabeum ATCC 11539]
MPLDGHAYLSSQGWAGKGSGLREGAISRPVIIAQKKTMAGVGRDRDEAFPFWDHLYSAAAKAIKLKVANSDEEDSADMEPSTSVVSFARTRTGIISNRRPVDGTPAASGTATPDSAPSDSSMPRVSLLTLARREAVKRGLYSMFFRGPVLGPDEEAIAGDETNKSADDHVEPQASGSSTSALKRRKLKDEKRHTKTSKKRKLDNEDQGTFVGEKVDNPAGPASSQGLSDDAESSAAKRMRTKEEKLARKARKEEKLARKARKEEKLARKARKEKRAKRNGSQQADEDQPDSASFVPALEAGVIHQHSGSGVKVIAEQLGPVLVERDRCRPKDDERHPAKSHKKKKQKQ